MLTTSQMLRVQRAYAETKRLIDKESKYGVTFQKAEYLEGLRKHLDKLAGMLRDNEIRGRFSEGGSK